MHMIERKQDGLNGAMLRALMAEHLREEREKVEHCLLYTSPSPRDLSTSRMPSSA